MFRVIDYLFCFSWDHLIFFSFSSPSFVDFFFNLKKVTSGIMIKLRLNISGKNGVLDGATCFNRITTET